jgi:hypothetical protein
MNRSTRIRNLPLPTTIESPAKKPTMILSIKNYVITNKAFLLVG